MPHLAARWARRCSCGWQRTLLALLVLIALAPLASPVAAQEQGDEPPPAEASPITIDVVTGYDNNGSYRVYHWFPITVVLSNDGPDVQGVLEWRTPGQFDSRTFERAIDLPRGARKRITLYAVVDSFVRVGEVRLLADGRTLAAQEQRITAIEGDQLTVAVVSSDNTVLNSVQAMNLPPSVGTTLLRVAPERLPTEPSALLGLNAIFLHDITTADLSDEQRAALALWVSMGGQLVVGGGIHSDATTSGLDALLPVDVGELRPNVPLAPLADFIRGEVPLESATTTAAAVTLRPGAAALDDAALLTAHPYGSGSVIFAAFDLAALQLWAGETRLWARVLDVDNTFSPAVVSRWQSRNLLFDALQLPELSLPSFWVLIIFVVGYVLMIGPLNFLVLRRLRRVDAAWITIPLLVLLFIVSTYGASLFIRGFRPQVMQISLVQAFEGQSSAYATIFQGMFSPRRSSYELTYAPDTLISLTDQSGSSNAQGVVRWEDSATVLDNLVVDVSALRTFIVEQAVTSEVAVRSSVERDGARVIVDLTYEGAAPLENALLVSNRQPKQLGTLQPGARDTFVIERNVATFPNVTLASDEGLFNQQSVLMGLFDGGRFGFVGVTGPGASELDRQGVYLLGWQPGTLLPPAIDATTAAQEGLTLYVVRLDEPRTP